MGNNKLMSIQIRQGHVRQAPSFLSAVQGVLPYGAQVRVQSEQEDWVNVLCHQSGLSGWLHASALTPKKIILDPSDKDVSVSASSDEYALAGKGFNEDVENRFRAGNPHLDFSWINRMETFNVSAQDKQNFLSSGRVYPERGV